MDYTKIDGDLQTGETYRIGVTDFLVRCSNGSGHAGPDGNYQGGGVYSEPLGDIICDSMPDDGPEFHSYEFLAKYGKRLTRVIRARNED